MLSLHILDLTTYEVANALMRGRARRSAEQVAEIVAALSEICPRMAPTLAELRIAARLAEVHDLSFHDAAYAAVARERDAVLVTADRNLLRAGLGESATTVVERLGLPGGQGRAG